MQASVQAPSVDATSPRHVIAATPRANVLCTSTSVIRPPYYFFAPIMSDTKPNESASFAGAPMKAKPLAPGARGSCKRLSSRRRPLECAPSTPAPTSGPGDEASPAVAAAHEEARLMFGAARAGRGARGQVPGVGGLGLLGGDAAQGGAHAHRLRRADSARCLEKPRARAYSLHAEDLRFSNYGHSCASRSSLHSLTPADRW